MSNMKIFHGLSEIAGQGFYTVQGLVKNNYDAKMMVWRDSPAGFANDYSFQINSKKIWKLPIWICKIVKKEVEIIRSYNVFHFHFGRTLLLNHDLWIMKRLKKKVFFEFHGSDLRDYKLAQKINPYLEYDNQINNQDFSKRTKKIIKYSNGIILHDDELISYLPKTCEKIYVVPLRVDLSLFEPVYQAHQTDRIRIVHAPTNRIGKGSPQIIEIVEELAKVYPIEFILVENKTQAEAKAIYASADIILDQICIGTYGVFAIEGMALGKPVVTYITDAMKNCLPDELPIISANKDTLKEQLIKLLESQKLREEIGRKGRQYTEMYHDYHIVTKYLGEIYKGNIMPLHGKEAFKYIKQIKMQEISLGGCRDTK